jgi:hypothetical protein
MMIGHAHAVSKDGPAGEGACGIDSNHPNRPAFGAHDADQAVDKRALARARRACDANAKSPSTMRKQRAQQIGRARRLVLDPRSRSRDRAWLPREDIRYLDAVSSLDA